MPAANHSFYLRNCYLENRLSKNEMVIAGKRLDLKSITVPIYNLATREDHIAPAKSVLLGSKFFGRPVRFVLAGSGHIAGVVNPPDKMKYQYWTGPKPTSANLDRWLGKAKEHPARGGRIGSIGSRRIPEQVAARGPAAGRSSRSRTRREVMLRSEIDSQSGRSRMAARISSVHSGEPSCVSRICFRRSPRRASSPARRSPRISPAR